ncbi:MAG: Gfo/Idh/MocA family oxidoreductase [Isosphaeraceae bacterium]
MSPPRVATRDRRTFLMSSACGMAGLGALGTSASARGANDRIGIGLIGVGGRASAHLGELLTLRERKNLEVVAVCDVWSRNAEAAARRVEHAGGRAPRRCSRYGDLLAMPDVDAVVIATPDFAHGTILNAAIAADRDVYIEKPMTIDLDSATRALDLARSRDRVVQAGTQRRSEGAFRAATRAIREGAIGRVSRVTASVNFNEPRWRRSSVADCVAADVDWDAYLLHLPKRPFDPHLLREWQLYRATSNGMPGLWMTHFADAVAMITGASYPARVVASGGTFVWKDGREHPDTFQATVEYPEGFLFDWSMSLGNSAGNRFTVHGSEGTIDVDALTIVAEPKPGRPAPRAQPLPREKGESHLVNWLDCVRSRKRPNADIEFGHQHVVATVMAAQAFETGRRQLYDTAKRAIVAG